MKTLKSVLLTGNDWLLHVAAGTYFALTLGWNGIFPAYLSHFLIDLIPHGHFTLPAKPKLGYALESIKGILAGAIICLIIWANAGFAKALMVAVNMLSALFFDFILVGAEILDEKEVWKKFSFSVGRVIMIILGSTFIICYLNHWFGRSQRFQSQWTEVKNHRCGVSGRGLKPGIWNIAQLAVAIILFVIISNPHFQ